MIYAIVHTAVLFFNFTDGMGKENAFHMFFAQILDSCCIDM